MREKEKEGKKDTQIVAAGGVNKIHNCQKRPVFENNNVTTNLSTTP